MKAGIIAIIAGCIISFSMYAFMVLYDKLVHNAMKEEE